MFGIIGSYQSENSFGRFLGKLGMTALRGINVILSGVHVVEGSDSQIDLELGFHANHGGKK